MKCPRSASALLVSVLLGLATVSLSACGSAPRNTDSTSTRPTAIAAERRGGDEELSASFERVRGAVLRGTAKDFAQGTGIGGPAFESCVRGLLGKALDRPTIARLVQVYRRPDGQQFAAQALNALASPLGAKCGHRPYVPELVEASRGLREGKPAGPAERALDVIYGPYLGVRCRRAGHIGCDRVGIDVVFSTASTRVTAVVGAHHLQLHTPGMHSGVRYRDWVGTFTRAGMDRPGSPFHVRSYGRAHAVWAGSPATYVPVELQVAFADSRTAKALFPGVFLSPGWG
jgi:hypothetical protein